MIDLRFYISFKSGLKKIVNHRAHRVRYMNFFYDPPSLIPLPNSIREGEREGGLSASSLLNKSLSLFYKILSKVSTMKNTENKISPNNTEIS